MNIWTAATIVVPLILLSSCDAPQSAQETADMVLTGGKIYTVDEEKSWAEAVAIKGDKIVYVGDDVGAQAYIGTDTKVGELNGKMVMPGFHDAHTHPVYAGVMYNQCSLFDIEGKEAMIGKIRQCVEQNPEAEWIRGGGWLMSNFEQTELVDKALLDAISSEIPMSFKSSDGHTVWANSKAIEIAGITSETPDPPGGRIDRYPGTKEPSGSFQEDTGMTLIIDHEPPYDLETLVDGLIYAQSHLNSLGITAIQDALLRMEGNDPYVSMPAYQALDAQGRLNMHVITDMYWEQSKDMDKQITAFEKGRTDWTGGHIQATAVKIWVDGVIETETAAMIDPYSNHTDAFRGESLNDPEALKQLVTRLDAKGFQIHFHSIGDRGIREALDSIEVADNTNGRRDRRYYMSHIEVWHPDDFQRIIDLDVVANYQPLWAINDSFITDLTLPRIGEERAKYLYPIGTSYRMGTKLAFGSDWYVSDANPLAGIEVAVTRLDPDGLTDVPLGEDEALPLDVAIEAYTMGSAYVNFLDERTGSIEVGKLADIIILDQNLFEIEPSQISETKVVTTLFEGRVVYGTLN